MAKLKPKKFLGQHFLNDLSIAGDIVNSLTLSGDYKLILEIGPGMGVLTDFLLVNPQFVTYMIEIDKDSVEYLRKKYPEHYDHIIAGDFLQLHLQKQFKERLGIIGNFPYNISSQIFFKVLENKDIVPEVVCMIQKEVADRIVAKPGNKTYGILSVLLQAFYNINYLFTVEPHVFRPPPKVRSAVIRLNRNKVTELDCDEALFRTVVKQGFQNRRKTLRNALKRINLPEKIRHMALLDKRAEQLSVNDFIDLTKKIELS